MRGAPARWLLLAAGTFALPAFASHANAQRPARATRVLLLYQQQAETQPMVDFAQGLRAAIRARLGSNTEFYQEALDFDRFAGREHSEPLAAYFDDKYRGFGIDVVVPVGGRALAFAVERSTSVFANVPIVFALCAAPQTDPSKLPPSVTGRLAPASRFAPTFSMARRLQPDARQVVVIGGAGGTDTAAVRAAVNAVSASHDSISTSVLEGLSLDALLSQLRQIPRQSIVIFANYRLDVRGQAFDPVDIIGSIARASAAPMYTQLRSYVGEGVVGGFVTKFDDEGVRTGQLVARVLERRTGEPMPPVEYIANSFVVDARQLRRWGLSEARLPAGTEVVFQEPTPWQRYRMIASLTLAVVAAESLLIGVLVFERRARKRAELHADEARRQIAHMGRVALVGELAATMSHELRQPLAAIRANAEAGALLLGRPATDRSEEQEIFKSIVAEDARAIEMIEGVRTLLRKDTPAVTTFDLNDVCRDAIRLLQHEAMLRRTRLEVTFSSTPLTVLGDPVQLKQAVVNVVLNGIEATTASTGDRVVTVQTRQAATAIELLVHDSGPGIPASAAAHLFESFFSTKTGGLGLGLVIVRSIVERHMGKVRAQNHPSGGAMFRVWLPIVPTDGGAPGVTAPIREARDEDLFSSPA